MEDYKLLFEVCGSIPNWASDFPLLWSAQTGYCADLLQ